MPNTYTQQADNTFKMIKNEIYTSSRNPDFVGDALLLLSHISQHREYGFKGTPCTSLFSYIFDPNNAQYGDKTG